MNVRDLHRAHVDALLARPDELTATDHTYTSWSPHAVESGVQRATFSDDVADLDDNPATIIIDGDRLP